MTTTSRTLCSGLLLTAFVTGCNIGMRPEDFSPALNPGGVSVALRAEGDAEDRVGELYAVDSIGVTVRTDRLVRVSWERLRVLDVDKLGGDYDVSIGERVAPEKRARLAALSRFPQGLSDALLSRVLAKLSLRSREEIR